MESDHAYQLILSTDKRNPSFSLYHCEEQESISVFYGLQLLEVIPDDPEHPTFKMMVGRLANAKVRIATLDRVDK
jgi:predicted regulator of amino acid metabolism with ACT domain